MALEEEPISKYTDGQWITNILKSLQEQREICRFCDVILKVCGEEIFVHSNVLAAASPYFASFLGTLQDHPRAFSQKVPQIIEIHIEGSNEAKIRYFMAVRKVVDFMYTSCIEITPSVITQVSEIAKIMQLDTILEICEEFRNGLSEMKAEPGYADGSGFSTLTTLVDEEAASDTKLGDHTYGILDGIGSVSINTELSAAEVEEENINRSQMTQTQTDNISASSVDSKNEEPKPFGDDDLDVTPSPVEEATDVNNAQMLASTDHPLLDKDETETDTIITDEVPPGVAEKEEASTDRDDTVTELLPLVSAPSERATPTVIIKSEPAASIVPLTPEEKEEGNFAKEASDQCSGAVRSSLRTRLGKKNTTNRHCQRKRITVKSRVATTINNKNNNTSNNGNVDEETENKDGKTGNKDVVEVYVCDDCLYSTCNYNHFKRHREQHRNQRYSCDKCDYKVRRLKALNDHKRTHLHAELQCSYCTYKGTDAEDLTAHLSRHSGMQPYFCPVCDLKFKNRTQLNQHLPKHSEDKPFVCTTCFAGFKWKHALKNHMVVHSENKDHLCDICGYATAHKSQLKTHRLIHTGETLKCSVEGCTFQALKQLNLKYHMLTHTNDKPHVCSVCNQSFSLIKNLRRHMLLHTDTQPYTCTHCSYKSTRYDKLKEHLLKRHNIGEQPSKRQRIWDYQVSGEKLMQESTEEEDKSTLQTIVVAENETDTISGTTQIVITSADNLQVPIAITRVNSAGYTEITYPNFQYV